MQINGVVIGFTIDPTDELKALVQKCGYSKPIRSERGVIARKDTYTHCQSVEIERINDTQNVFITAWCSNPKNITEAVREIINDLAVTELIAL